MQLGKDVIILRSDALAACAASLGRRAIVNLSLAVLLLLEVAFTLISYDALGRLTSTVAFSLFTASSTSHLRTRALLLNIRQQLSLYLILFHFHQDQQASATLNSLE